MIIQCGPGMVTFSLSIEESPSTIPLAYGVAFAVREWARRCERNVREGRHRDDDGELYFCGSWLPRNQCEQYYVAEQRKLEAERAAR